MNDTITIVFNSIINDRNVSKQFSDTLLMLASKDKQKKKGKEDGK